VIAGRVTARRLDGTAAATAIRGELRDRIRRFTERRGRPPALAIVLAGADPASEIYVSSKLRTAAEAGCRADMHRLPADAPAEDALAVVARLNDDDGVDGILVQSPLPAAMGRDAEQRVFDALSPLKDVDGFHPANVGRLAQKRATLVACTPAGVMQLLARERVPIAGRRAVVIGRSDIVGKPMALLLLHADATVTVCHSRTPDVATHASQADLLVAAVGRPGYVTPAFV
jgi:methylenetetrahydrofolate dehydrogenase (NADP+)/methenyltetrahydrofolate cyclohydrolase